MKWMRCMFCGWGIWATPDKPWCHVHTGRAIRYYRAFRYYR